MNRKHEVDTHTKTTVIGLSFRKWKDLAVLTQYRAVTDGQT